MKRYTTVIQLMFVAFAIFSSLACAGNWMNKKEVENLLSGNTAKGFYMKEGQSLSIMQKVGIKIKFFADGRAEQTTSRVDATKGTYTEKGKWWVNKKGKLCMTWEVEDKKKCGRVRRNSDGNYELVRKKTTFVYEELIPGT